MAAVNAAAAAAGAPRSSAATPCRKAACALLGSSSYARWNACAAGRLVAHHVHAFDGADAGEQRVQILIVGFEGQIAHIEFLGHEFRFSSLLREAEHVPTM